MVVTDLEKEIKGANRWLANNHNIKLLYTQREGVRFLMNYVNNKENQLRKSLKEQLLELLKKGYLDKVMVYGTEDEIKDIINEIPGKVSNNNMSTVNFSYNDWEIHKPSNAKNELTAYINAIAKLLIELSSSPDKLSDKLHHALSNILDHIDKMPAMTFDEEIEKIFAETGILLMEKCDIELNESNEKGITVINRRYADDWELFLWWAISKENFCRCILHSPPNNFSIIGLADNVKEVEERYELQRTEIIDDSNKKATNKVISKLNLLPKDKKGNTDQNSRNEIKSRKDYFIKYHQLSMVKDLLSNTFVTSKNAMTKNDDTINTFIKENLKSLGRASFNIEVDLTKYEDQYHSL